MSQLREKGGLEKGGQPHQFLQTSSTHHFQPPQHRMMNVVPFILQAMRHQAHGNILLLLITQRKYTCGTHTGAHPLVVKWLPDLFPPHKYKTSREALGGQVLLLGLTVSEISQHSGFINNSSTFGKRTFFSYSFVVSES